MDESPPVRSLSLTVGGSHGIEVESDVVASGMAQALPPPTPRHATPSSGDVSPLPLLRRLRGRRYSGDDVETAKAVGH